MEKDLPTPAGSALSGKEQHRRPEDLPAKTRVRKTAKKVQTRQLVDASVKKAESEDATAGDDFYTSVLERFGIQI